MQTITITKEFAADLVKILAAGQHPKYTWQQVSAYMGALQQEIIKAEAAAVPPPPDELFKVEAGKLKPEKKPKPKAKKR